MTTQDKILAAAQELFGELGYSGTTFKKIAERGEITLGLISPRSAIFLKVVPE